MSDVGGVRGVLFVGAHPDDETVLVGGTLAMLAARGIPTHVICVTDGRGGEAGGVPEAEIPAQRAEIRARELACAAAALGVRTLIPFGYEDPLIGPDDALYGFAAEEAALAGQIADAVRGLVPVDVILTHGTDGEYGHPAHRQVHQAVRRAVRELLPGVLLYTTSALIPGREDRLSNPSDPAHLALDITPWAEAKVAAMECHRTQHALFMRRRQLTRVRDALRTLESFRRQWPPVDGPAPNDPFANLLRAAGAWDPFAAGA